MPRTSNKKRVGVVAKSRAAVAASLSGLHPRAGLPALDSVVEVRPLTPPTAALAGATKRAGAKSARTKYRILRTNEVDEYEAAAKLSPAARKAGAKTAKAATKKAAATSDDDFTGDKRKAAKLSIGTSKIKKYADLKTLIASLPAETVMINHTPTISNDAASGRVKEEQRNVRVRAFLYAASKESDNDFHLIIGRDPKKTPEVYMTMELSGLPPKTSASFPQLKVARDAYKNFFAGNLPGAGYDFPDPPVPVEIEGSLYFDMPHATGTRPGPKSLKSRMPTIWEVHPITKIIFEP
jgi:SepF-like predicted cell division protein (DUF552 family)